MDVLKQVGMKPLIQGIALWAVISLSSCLLYTSGIIACAGNETDGLIGHFQSNAVAGQHILDTLSRLREPLRLLWT